METVIKDFEARLKAAVAELRQEFLGIRSNRPTPQLLDNIKVDYFGQALPIKQLGTIGVSLPREIYVTVWDKNAAPAVAKAIEISPLRLNPSVDGNVVRMILPPLTEERKLELIRLVKSIAEKTRIRMRSGRDETNKRIDKAFAEKQVSEDQKFKLKKLVQEAVGKTDKEIEELVAAKAKEISE